jgi:hypothetical protein
MYVVVSLAEVLAGDQALWSLHHVGVVLSLEQVSLEQVGVARPGQILHIALDQLVGECLRDGKQQRQMHAAQRPVGAAPRPRPRRRAQRCMQLDDPDQIAVQRDLDQRMAGVAAAGKPST